MVADAADYRFCSYGVWSQTGRHPFAAALCNSLIPALPSPLQTLGPKELRRELRQSFARAAAEEAQAVEDEAANSVAAAGREPPFTLSARRHVRHWVDGLVIGSELFVRDTMRRVRSSNEVKRHRLASAVPKMPDALPICCWRRLRVMLN